MSSKINTRSYDFCHSSCSRGVFARAARPAPKTLGRGPAPGRSAHNPPAPAPARHRRPARSARKGARTGSILRGEISAHPEPGKPAYCSRRMQQHTQNAPGAEPERTGTPDTPAQQQPSPLAAAACNSMRVCLVADCFDRSLRCPARPYTTTSLRAAAVK